MPRAGRLDQRLSLLRESSTSYDSLGQFVSDAETVATVWGEVIQLSGQEAEVARKQEADATHQVTIRYSSDVAGLSPEYWITWGSRRLNVASVIDTDQRHQQLVLLCAEDTS